MKRITIWTTLVAIALIGFSAIAQDEAAASLDAEAILDRVNAAWQGDTFHAILTLDIVLGGQTKSHKLEVWTLGEELALIRVLEPEIDLNSGYLQLGDDLWYYSPTVGSIKLPSVALGDALFGAGPSLEDLSHGTLSDDYDTTVEIVESEGSSQYCGLWEAGDHRVGGLRHGETALLRPTEECRTDGQFHRHYRGWRSQIRHLDHD